VKNWKNLLCILSIRLMLLHELTSDQVSPGSHSSTGDPSVRDAATSSVEGVGRGC